MTDTGTAAPTAQRIETLDFVRGMALFGILLMNITAFGLPEAYNNPRNYGGAEGADLWSWIIIQIVFEGTQRGLFSLLFGAGVILFTARLEASGRPDAADIYFRRNLWLVGFGFVNAFVFLWYGDILYTYGVVALFVFAFRKLTAKKLLLIGIAALLAGTVWSAVDTGKLLAKHDKAVAALAVKASTGKVSKEQQEAIKAWEEARDGIKAPPAKIDEAIKAMRGGYISALGHVAGMNAYWQSWGLYRYFFEIFGTMLIGMALFKLGVLTLERPTRLYLAMLVGGYGVGLTTNILEVRHIMTHDFSALAFSEANISYDLGRLAMTIGHLGLLLLFVRSGLLAGLRRAVAAVGQMALTSYLTHSVVCAILFIGLGFYGAFARHQLYYVVFSIWIVQLIVSPIWLKHYRFGPVEWLWRWLTYGTRSPMRRAQPTIGEVAPAA